MRPKIAPKENLSRDAERGWHRAKTLAESTQNRTSRTDVPLGTARLCHVARSCHLAASASCTGFFGGSASLRMFDPVGLPCNIFFAA